MKDKSRYEGEMRVDGTRTGKGIMWFARGDIYCGDWLNDFFHGYGIYVHSNGERYEG